MLDLAALYQRWNSRVVGVALQILGDPDEADEVAQAVFIDVWRRSGRYDSARGSEWAWLRTMTQSRCLDRLRAARRKDKLARLVYAEHVPAADEEEDTTACRLLERLPQAQRVLLELAFLDGFTHRQIAQRTGQPLGTVKSRIRLGLQRLAGLLRKPRGRPAGKAEPERVGAPPVRLVCLPPEEDDAAQRLRS